jgi:phage tail-like protein
MPETAYPFNAFNFSVEIQLPGERSTVCQASFAECDGLEMSMEVKTIREGGNNGAQIRLSGPVTYGQVSLKRGMTATFDLWDWFGKVIKDPALRADATIVLSSADRTPRAQWQLARCVPVKLKAPPMNAKEGIVAIEEFQMTYETLSFDRPKSQ